MEKVHQSSEVHSALDLIAPCGDGWAWTFRGWACDVNNPDEPIHIEIREAGQLIATTVPTMLRPDVAKRYNSHGTHGFCFAMRGGGNYRDIEITANGNPIGAHLWDMWNWTYDTPFRPSWTHDFKHPILNILYQGKNFHAGMITPYEMHFMLSQIQAKKVTCALEIGTASGMSTVGIAMAISAGSDGQKIPLYSVDAADSFYDDESIELGITAKRYADHEAMKHTEIHICASQTRRELPDILGDQRVDFAFIDADHKHPGTTLDLICTLPLSEPGCTFMFHDLELGEKKESSECGPSRLWKSLPEEQKKLGLPNTQGNIGAFHHHGNPRELSEHLANALLTPWTGDGGRSEEDQAAIRKVMEEHYDPCLVEAWDNAAEAARKAKAAKETAAKETAAKKAAAKKVAAKKTANQS